MRLLFADFGVSLDTAQAESAERCYRVAYDVNRRAVPGVRELLAALHPHLKIVVVTNGITSEQTEKLTICGLTPFIHDLVTPHDAGAKKPDPRMFTFALARAECPAEAAIMVGDSWALDVVGARAAGLRSIWLDRHGEKCPEEGVTTRITQFEPSNKRWPQELRDAFPCL
jgi:HAD superfamily hydrolase (TIGR01549 family)